MSLTSSSVEFFAKEWVKLYRQKPVLTALTTLVAIACLVVAFVEFQAYEKNRKDAVRLENSTYSKQIKQLDDMESSVAELLTFLDDQKKSMRDTQDALDSLKTERDNLAPLVQSDREVIDSIFLAQEQRSESNIWTERWIGFGFGIVASLIASFLWFVGVALMHSNQKLGETATPQPISEP